MSEQPYMQLWIADFVGDTLHLTSEEVGQYMLLLMAMWRNGGYLPDDAGKLARIARGPVSDGVMAFFSKCPANASVCQKRLLAELDKARAKQKARQEAGKAGAEAKALKHKEAAQANATANGQAKVPAKVQHSPVPEPLATNVAKREKRAHALPPDWQPSESHFREGEELGFSARDVEGMAQDMRLWAGAKGETKKNWDMAFSGWMRREKKNGRRGHGPPAKEQHFRSVVQQFIEEADSGNGVGIAGSGGRAIRGASGKHNPGELHAATPGLENHAGSARQNAGGFTEIDLEPDGSP